MASQISKQALSELAYLTRPTAALQPTAGAIPREDLMERAADLLEDPWARVFFTTAAGFTRLHLLMAPHQKPAAAKKNALQWLLKRFPQTSERPELAQMLATITEECMHSVNLNITFKRLTSILTQSERAVIAEGLLDLLAPEANLKPEQLTIVEEVLVKVLLSQQAGMELLENWKRKRTPKTII